MMAHPEPALETTIPTPSPGGADADRPAQGTTAGGSAGGGTDDGGPGAGGSGPGSEGALPPRGLLGQLGATRDAIRRLVTTHIDLAKTELGEIWDRAKRALALAAAALAVALYLVLLLSVGSALFLGEWIFGSMGWGLLHGLLSCLAMILTLALAALEVPAWRLGRAFVVGAVLAVLVAVLLGYGWAHDGWSRLGDAVIPGANAGNRPLVAAVLGSAIVLGFIGLLLGTRGGGAGAFAGLFVGIVAGVVVGILGAISYPLNAGAGLGVCVGLIAWMAIEAFELRGYDWAALKSHYWPSATIDTTKETIEWVRARTPLGRKP